MTRFLFSLLLSLLALPASADVYSPVPQTFDDGTTAAARPLANRLVDKGLVLGAPVFLRVFKVENIVEVWLQKGESYALFDSYPICKWSGSMGPKLLEGDGQAPEGFYEIRRPQLKYNSQFYRALNMGFPNAYDRALNRTGGLLMLHGGCRSVGCYAMTDAGIDDIYRIVEASFWAGADSVPLHAFPFRMTETTLQQLSEHRWYWFWRTLKPGYDHFEQHQVPPDAYVCGSSYRIVARGEGAPEGCQAITGWPG